MPHTLKQKDELAVDRHANRGSIEDRRRQALEDARRQIAEMTEEEDREITDNALADPDNPPRDEAFFKRWERPVGRPIAENPKEKVTIRLDADLAERLRASGKGWQSRANAMLRKAVGLE